MCGIVGVYGKIGPKQLDIFDELFQINVLRGTDSCGVAVLRGEETQIVKDVLWPDDLIMSDEYIAATKNPEGITGVIGHNRAQTRGKVSKENAHPFKHGDITLVHNGTVRTYRFPGPDKDTDSETICDHLNRSGIDKVWHMIDGAAAIVYHDKKTNKLYAATNGQRPLGFLLLDGILYLASEPWMIVCAFFRTNVKIKLDDFWILDKNKLYEFDINENGVSYTSRKLKEYEPPISERRTGYYYGGDYYRDDYGIGAYEGIDGDEDGMGMMGLKHHTGCNCYGCCEKRRKAILEEAKAKEESKSEDAPFDTTPPISRLASPIRKVAALNINSREKRGITEAEFRKHYHDCSFCGGSLEGDYKNSCIINHNTKDALCGVCATTGELVTASTHKQDEVTVH